MRYLRAICRFTVGIIFILSGFLKAVDPIGNSLKIDEYLKAFHLGFLDFTSVPAGILLSAAEFLIGVCILKGIKMKLCSYHSSHCSPSILQDSAPFRTADVLVRQYIFPIGKHSSKM